MWPMYVDYSDEECKRILRGLEMEAYASVVNAFRAQGSLTKDRRKTLQDLSSALKISVERHRAEVRRAVNDEHLSTVAERLSGPNTSIEWAIEGRRVVPLMQRLAPQTVFTEIANSVASAQVAKNAALPFPGKTGTREMSNGVETMASRKRRDYTPDIAVSPQKIPALDSQYFHSLLPPEHSGGTELDPITVPDTPLNSEGLSSEPSIPLSFSDLSAQMALPMTNPSPTPPKPLLKQPLLKSSSVIATCSSTDEKTPSLLTSRATSQVSPPVITIEEPTSSEAIKPSIELKTPQRQISSATPLKSSTIVIPTTVSSASHLPPTKERVHATPSGSKFMHQLRSKAPGHARHALPAGLGMKMSSQNATPQRSPLPLPKSPIMKMKPDSMFSKKPASAPFSSDSKFSSALSSEPLTITKSHATVAKSSSKLETTTTTSSAHSGAPPSPKQTPVAKTVPKPAIPPAVTTPTTTSQNSGYISRAMFTAPAKTTANNKSMPPVIFNVATTTTSASLPTAAKVSTPVASDSTTKSASQILPKSTTVGITSSHLKINASNTQTIQYRNDGGLVRSARIVNISQPVGSRLPCAISSSAISALGLSNSLSSTALRVTLPAGTLNPSSSLRVSAAAKPNVIVVHKAQMWPRAQQGAAAVIMSSGPLSKVQNDMVQETIITTKQDKKPTTPSASKPAPRAIAPARPQSPAVSVTSIRISESSLMQSPSASQPDSTTPEAPTSKASEQAVDAHCKKNLLVDIIEESGILDNSIKSVTREKGNEVKIPKELVNLSNHQELEVTAVSQKSSTAVASESSFKQLPDSSVTKVENKFRSDPFHSKSQPEKHHHEVFKLTPSKLQDVVQSREGSVNLLPLFNTGNEAPASSSDSATPEKNSSKEES